MNFVSAGSRINGATEPHLGVQDTISYQLENDTIYSIRTIIWKVWKYNGTFSPSLQQQLSNWFSNSDGTDDTIEKNRSAWT